MTLQDLRRYAIRHQVRIHFNADPGGECLVDEHGVLKIPSLQRVPDFQVDSTLASVEEFVLSPVPVSAKPVKQERLSRSALQSRLSGPAAEDAEDHHEPEE